MLYQQKILALRLFSKANKKLNYYLLLIILENYMKTLLSTLLLGSFVIATPLAFAGSCCGTTANTCSCGEECKCEKGDCQCEDCDCDKCSDK